MHLWRYIKVQMYLRGQPSEPRKQCLDQSRSSSRILLGVSIHREIILSQNVLNQATELKLEMTPAELAKKSFSSRSNRYPDLSTASDPFHKKQPVSRMIEMWQRKIIAVNCVLTWWLQRQMFLIKSFSPNIKRNRYWFCPRCIDFILVILSECIDDRVKKPEDIEEVRHHSIRCDP